MPQSGINGREKQADRVRLAACILSLCYVLGCTANQKSYRGLPESRDYPLPQNMLLEYRDREQLDKIRDHIWAIYSDLTNARGDGIPLWETWFAAQDVLGGKGTPETSPDALGPPTQFQVGFAPEIRPNERMLDRFQTTFEKPEASIVYNKELRDFILDRRLWDAKTIDELNSEFDDPSKPPVRNTPISERNIPALPNKSVALKLFWEVVFVEAKEVGVWEPDPNMCAAVPHVPGEKGQKVYVEPCVDQPDSSGADNCKSLTKDHISMSGFYHVKVPPLELKHLLDTGQLGFNASRLQAETEKYTAYKILVGFHLALKEIPDWVWATFWWHPQLIDPASQQYADGRPGSLKGEWGNYLMDTTLSMESPHPVGRKTPKACFNPYFEATDVGGVASNCMRCHRQAAYPVGCTRTASGGLSDDDAGYFSGTTKVDYLWSLALGRNDGSPTPRRFDDKCPPAPEYTCGPSSRTNPLTK